MKSVKWRELVRKMHTAGCAGPLPGGKHLNMKRGKQTITIPNPHGNKEVSAAVVRSIVKALGINEDQWNKL